VFRLEHPECVRFHQIVLFGTRRKAHARGEPKGIDALFRAGYRPGSIPTFKADLAERYVMPPSDPTPSPTQGCRSMKLRMQLSAPWPCKMPVACWFASSKR
jgi:hypothetical protein